MNRAVAARLKDPNLSLYGALFIGGFNFPSSDEASTLDDENVTLGQRKNQLLRRLREYNRKPRTRAKTQKRNGHKEVSVDRDALVHLSRRNSLLGGWNNAQGLSTGNSAFVPLGTGKPKLCECLPETSPEAHDTTPIIAASYIPSKTRYGLTALGVPPRGSMERTRADFATKQSEKGMANPGGYFSQASKSGSAAGPPSAFPRPGIPLNDDDADLFDAACLSSDSTCGISPNTAVARQSSPSSVDTTPNPMDFRERKGLQLFQEGLQAIYQRSMMKAGYSREETHPSSHCYRRFAFLAWQQECLRLQLIMGAEECSQGSLSSAI